MTTATVSTVSELLAPGGLIGPDEPAGRWAFYGIGASMCACDTQLPHQPGTPQGHADYLAQRSLARLRSLLAR